MKDRYPLCGLIAMLLVAVGCTHQSSRDSKSRAESPGVISGVTTPGRGYDRDHHEIAVPNVLGKPAARARMTLEAQGFVVRQTYSLSHPQHATAKPRTVIYESPGGGSRAKRGTTVTINVW